MDKYRAIIPELRDAGIGFRPMVWTSDGVPHPAAQRTLAFAADIAARKMGTSRKALVKRWSHEVTVAILRRRAAMVRECLPKQTERERWLLGGSIGADVVPWTGRRGEGKLRQLDDTGGDSTVDYNESEGFSDSSGGLEGLLPWNSGPGSRAGPATTEGRGAAAAAGGA